MSWNNDNLDGRNGVQQPKRKRRNHKDNFQWSRHHWENILKTNMQRTSSHGSLITYQAQQEPQKVQVADNCDLSLFASTKIDDPHSKVSSAAGAGITYQAKEESVKGSHNCDLSLGSPIEVISNSMASRAVFTTALLSQGCEGCSKADASLLTGVLPENPSIGNFEMPAAPHFSSKNNSQFPNLQSSLRKVVDRDEKLSERENRKADTYALHEMHIPAGDSIADPRPNSVSHFPLELALPALKGNSIREHGSPSGVGLRSESVLPSVENDGLTLLLSARQDQGRVQKDSAIQNPFQQPEFLSTVSSEVHSPACTFTDSVHHQSSKRPHVSSLKGKGKLLDSDRKSIHSDFRSAFLEKGVEISALEILSGLGSAIASSLGSPSRLASKRGSPSSHVTPPREASKKIFPSTATRSSKAVSKRASPSTLATPPKSASDKILSSTSATPPRAASQTISSSTRFTRSGHIPTPVLRTLSQQERRPSSGNNPLSSQNELPSNRNEGTSNQNNQSLDQLRRLSNLSRVTSNQEINPSASSGRIKSSFKGVSLFKRTGRYEAHFWNSAEKRQEYLGTFSTEEQAARAYDRATLYFRGRNEKLHFQLDDYAGELPRLVALTKDQLLSMLKEQGHQEGSRYPTYPS